MPALTCGRCGERTAIGSTFCPRCRWVLLSARPVTIAPNGDLAPPLSLDAMPEAPHGPSGMMARRRIEKARTQIETDLANLVDSFSEKLEKALEDDGENAQLHFRLGTLHTLRASGERGIAHLQRAHTLDKDNRDIRLNLGIALAQRGQVQPALMMLSETRTLFPTDADVLLNLALVALQARRPHVTHEATMALEKLWERNNSLIASYYESTLTARGLALLQMKNPDEALITLKEAAHHDHAVRLDPTSSPQSVNDGVPESDEEIAAKFAILSDSPQTDEFVQSGSFSTSADFLNNLALAEAELGEFDRAQAHLNTAVRIEPANARVDSNLGVLAFQRGDTQTAFKYLDIARQIEEGSTQSEPSTRNHMGVILSSLGRTDEAWREFGLAGGHEHADFEVWYNIGRAYVETGKPDKGISYLRKAFAIDQQHPDVHCLLAASYLLRQKPDNNLIQEAIKHFKRALQLHSRHLPSLLGLAMACEQTDNVQGAQVVMAQALKLYPNSSPVLFLRALFTMRLENDPEHIARAGTYFTQARAAQTDLIACEYNAALCQYLMGMQESAAHQLDYVVQQDPSFTPAYYLIGIGHAKAERYEKALAAWQIAMQQEPSNVDLHCDMGFVYYQQKNWQSSINSFHRASQLAPQDPNILASLGLCCGRAAGAMRDERKAREDKRSNSLIKTASAATQARDAEEARVINNLLLRSVGAFQQSLQINAHNPITHSNLGLSLYFQNEVEKAVDQWRVVSRLDARYAEKREDEQYRNFDDSQMQLRPVRWRELLVGMSPLLPASHTRLVPGYNARTFRPALPDAELQKLHTLRRQLEHTTRLQSWMNAKRT